ncbi:SAM-dependent methyltransferase [Afifella pfennigii]|uniref:SAM-dependent methyltransferase n=1 Tax=Afifella pfennigii TaxID=209897 RepID=UPI00068F9C59|nr:class I SAM-dependent methyltransferase [Afifella pfennigii]
MTPSLEAEIAGAMEASAVLLPHLPYLLQDLPSLSGADDEVLAVLRRFNLPPGGRVLDLGCGRGDLAIRLAREFGAVVKGFDGHPGFIGEAQRAARTAGVHHACHFVAADLRSALAEGSRYDAVLLIAVGPVLGDAGETMEKLRAVTRPGGLIVIDDAYLTDGAEAPAGYGMYRRKAEVEAALTRFGDAILAVHEGSDALAAFNDLALEVIPKRAGELKQSNPQLAEALDAYVAGQIEEVALLNGPIIPTLWALRRSGS